MNVKRFSGLEIFPLKVVCMLTSKLQIAAYILTCGLFLGLGI